MVTAVFSFLPSPLPKPSTAHNIMRLSMGIVAVLSLLMFMYIAYNTFGFKYASTSILLIVLICMTGGLAYGSFLIFGPAYEDMPGKRWSMFPLQAALTAALIIFFVQSLAIP
jgi:hypothetical protein